MTPLSRPEPLSRVEIRRVVSKPATGIRWRFRLLVKDPAGALATSWRRPSLFKPSA